MVLFSDENFRCIESDMRYIKSLASSIATACKKGKQPDSDQVMELNAVIGYLDRHLNNCQK